jgi:hypothetical protein
MQLTSAPLNCLWVDGVGFSYRQPGDPSWGTAYPTIVYQVWKTTGDVAVINQHLPHLVAYVASLERSANASGLGRMYVSDTVLYRFYNRHVELLNATVLR